MKRLTAFLVGVAAGAAALLWFIGRSMRTPDDTPEEIRMYTEYDGTDWTYKA